MTRTRIRRGFSLLEVVISTSLLVFIMLIVAIAVQNNAEQSRFDLATNEAAAAARKIMAQISRELSNSGGELGGIGETVTPPFGAGGTINGTAHSVFPRMFNGSDNNFRFRARETVVAVGSTWGPEISYRLENRLPITEASFDDGIDDDKDGVIDERALVRVQAGVPDVVMDNSVTTFRIDRTGGSDVLTVTLEVARGWQLKPITDPRDSARVRLVTNVTVMNRMQ